MIASRLEPDLAITWAKRRWRGAISPAASISAITMMPFMGVRISWLMVARKSDLARLACSATSLATLRSAVRAATSPSSPVRWAAMAASRVRISAAMRLKPWTRSPISSSAWACTSRSKPPPCWISSIERVSATIGRVIARCIRQATTSPTATATSAATRLAPRLASRRPSTPSVRLSSTRRPTSRPSYRMGADTCTVRL